MTDSRLEEGEAPDDLFAFHPETSSMSARDTPPRLVIGAGNAPGKCLGGGEPSW
jgi:hypothetical protein